MTFGVIFILMFGVCFSFCSLHFQGGLQLQLQLQLAVELEVQLALEVQLEVELPDQLEVEDLNLKMSGQLAVCSVCAGQCVRCVAGFSG